MPELKYWPTDRLEVFGVPYVGLEGLAVGVDTVKQHLIWDQESLAIYTNPIVPEDTQSELHVWWRHF